MEFPDSLKQELHALVGVARATISWPPEAPTRHGGSQPWKCRVQMKAPSDEECETVTRRLREWHTDAAKPLRDRLVLWFEPEGLTDDTMRRYGYRPARASENAATEYWVNTHIGSFRPRAEAERVVLGWVQVDAWGKSTLFWMKEDDDGDQ